MARLVLKMSMSLDGCMNRTDGSNDFIFPTYTPDAQAWTNATLNETSAHLMGATTYRAMASAWPGSTSDTARYMNEKLKVVFSNSMTESIWDETEFIAGDLATGIASLKARFPANALLLAHGGARFARSLCATGLIDELHVLVHPVILGEGMRIFPQEMPIASVETKVFSGGAVAHICQFDR